jgi:hypothetical protein
MSEFYRSIGVTGTRNGLSEEQANWIDQFLIYNAVNVLHHGDCVGVDEQVALKFADRKAYIIAHPGLDVMMYRANCKVNDLVLPGKAALNRNRYIVQCSELLLAFPNSETDALRSGTWFTIRHAKKVKVPTIIVTPTGKVTSDKE